VYNLKINSIVIVLAVCISGCQSIDKAAPLSPEVLIDAYYSTEVGLDLIEHFEESFGEEFYSCFVVKRSAVQSQILSSLDACVKDTLEPLETFDSHNHYKSTIDDLGNCFIVDLLIKLEQDRNRTVRDDKICLDINQAYTAIISQTNPYAAYLAPTETSELLVLIDAANKRKRILFPEKYPTLEQLAIKELASNNLKIGSTKIEVLAEISAPSRKLNHKTYDIWLYKNDWAFIFESNEVIALQKCKKCWEPRVKGAQAWMHKGYRDDQVISRLNWKRD